MLLGYPRRAAAAAAGISDEKARRWEREWPEFHQAVAQAREYGFGSVHEAEIYDRAMDREDRASGRLLEMVAKRHEPEFRDKHQVDISVIRAALEAQEAWVQDALPRPPEG